jgi:DNA-nicking Smr family endonuclease
MNFEAILDQWERRGVSQAEGVLAYNKDEILDARRESSPERRRRLLRKTPDGTIDLHGLTQDEAWDALGDFFDNARAQGLEKLLVIHGKGNHAGPENSGPLKTITRSFIERCPFAGESGYSAAAQGGSGSTWVLLKA